MEKESPPDVKEVKDIKEEAPTQIPSKPKKKRRLNIDKQLSFKTFLISHFLILLVSVAFISIFAWIIYGDNSPLDKQNYNPVTKEPISFSLDISSPEDNLLVFESSIVVSGKTDPQSTILITRNTESYGLEADTKGNFTKVVNLIPGVNNIYISAYDSKGSVKTSAKTVYYSEEKL